MEAPGNSAVRWPSYDRVIRIANGPSFLKGQKDQQMTKTNYKIIVLERHQWAGTQLITPASLGIVSLLSPSVQVCW
jgi:hypothetical protein